MNQNQRPQKSNSNKTSKDILKCGKEVLLANLYLMKIHFLILKLFIIKEFSFLDDEGLSLDASIITRSSPISLIPKNSGIPQAEFSH